MKMTYIKRKKKGLELDNKGNREGDKRFGVEQQRQFAQRERKTIWN